MSGCFVALVAILAAGKIKGVSAEVLESLSDAYETVEAQVLGLIRARAEREVIAEAARRAAAAAEAFNLEAYRMLHASAEGAWMPLDQLTERTEVLAELWADLADAYEA